MLDEAAPWLERRASFQTLYVSRFAPRGNPVLLVNLMIIPPLAPLTGYGFDLIVAPLSVQREHKDWLEQIVTRLKPGGKLIITGDT